MSDRETLDVDILIVGGGPAGLAAALRLSQLQQRDGGEPLSVALLEKAKDAGAHSLSGAVLDPSTLRDLIPDFESRGAPLAAPVGAERVYFLTAGSAVSLPVIPPPLRNHGNYIISLNSFVRWLAEQVDTAGGIDLFSGFAGQDVLMDGTRVVGVRTGDRGIDRQGRQKPGFEAGVDIRAKVTLFCDGVRGNLTKQLLRRLELGAGRGAEQFAVGLKELWELPAGRLAPGTVVSHAGVPAAPGGVRRCIHLRHARQPRLRSASSSGSTTGIRCSIRTWRSIASSSIRLSRVCWTVARWCDTAPRRCPKAAGTRFRGFTWMAA